MTRLSPLAVLLAGGRSTRMGTPKALLDWFGIPLWQAHLNALPLQTRVVSSVPLPCPHQLVRTDSMGASAAAALVGHQGPVLFVPVDTVPQPTIVSRLITCSQTTVPLDRHGRRGHPVWLSAEAVDVLRSTSDPNLRDITRHAVLLPTLSLTCSLDFDTPEDLEEVRRVARGGLEPPTPRV